MAKITTNFGLIKPERSDNYSVDVMADNMDIIDEKLGVLEPLSVIQVDENQNVTFPGTVNAEGGVILNKTVTVSASTMKITHNQNYSGRDLSPFCSYVPGVLYTGYIQVGTSYVDDSYYVNVYILSSSDEWTIAKVKPTNPSTSTKYNFTNVKCVMVQFGGTNVGAYYYLPIFS